MSSWLPRFRSSSARLLLLGFFLYQLGACPCGCLDHNYWLQAFGYESDHDHQLTSLPHFPAISDDVHDCEGHPRPSFCKTLNPNETTIDGGRSHERPCLGFTVMDAKQPIVFVRDRAPPDSAYFARSSLANLATLQAFLL